MNLRRKKTSIDPARVYLGKALRPHGLQGEIKFHAFGCDVALLEELEFMYTDADSKPVQVEYIRGTDEEPILKISGIDSRDDAEAIKGTIYWVPPGTLPELEQDFYYESDILFSEAHDPDGNRLGRIDSVIETGECDVLVIRGSDGQEIMVPASREFVLEIKPDESIVVVNPPRISE